MSERYTLNKCYEFGPFRIEPARRLLLRDGAPLPLMPKAFDALLLLVERHGRLLEKDELMKSLWPDVIVEENNLNQKISLLRRTLGENRDEHKYIVTIPGHGYSFVAEVREVSVEPQNRGSDTQRAIRTIAVLPFRPPGVDGSDEYLGLGMADALITRLGKIRQLSVRHINTVLSYTKAERDSVHTGRELGVDLILDGSIQKAAGRIRVTVRLLSVSDGSMLWSEKFDEHLTNIFAVEDSISEQVARALMLKLTTTEKKHLTTRHTENAEAYQLYLKSRYFWNKRTAEGLKKSIEYCQQAVASDPDFALAYAGLADGYNLLNYYGGTDPRESYPKAKGAVEQALILDDTLAEAHAALGRIKMCFDWDWPAAEREFRRAIDLNPNYPSAHQWYADYLFAIEHTHEALAEMALAQQLDPVSLMISADLAWAYYYAGQYDEVISQCQKVLEMDSQFIPALWFTGWAYEQQGRHELAINALLKAVDLSGRSTKMLSELGYAFAIAGRRDEAERALNELMRQAGERFVSPYEIALIHVGLGDMNQSFAWLERAFERRSWELIFLRIEPKLKPLTSDDRFMDLVRRIGFGR